MQGKTILSIIVIIICTQVLLSCSGKENTQGKSQGTNVRNVVGASLLTQTHVFYQDLSIAMKQTADKLGLTLRIQYAEFDPRRQNDQIELFLRQNVNAIVISPTDSSGMAPVVRDAISKSIPVFTVDIAVKDVEVMCHIASDNYQGGQLLGRYLAEQLNFQGKVAIIDHPTVTSVQERVRGFEEELSEYPGMTIIQKVPGEGQRDKAMRSAQDLIASKPDLDAIFGINDDSALGALAAVESAGLQEKIKIVGFDATPEACEAIRKGTALIADVAQYPKEIGRVTMETVGDYLNGKTVPKVKYVPVKLITKEILEKEGL